MSTPTPPRTLPDLSRSKSLPSASGTRRPSLAPRPVSLIETYALAHTARRKLSREVSRDCINLRLLVGHANTLDGLMSDMERLELEQERRYTEEREDAVASEARSVAEKAADEDVMKADHKVERNSKVRWEGLKSSETKSTQQEEEARFNEQLDGFPSLEKSPKAALQRTFAPKNIPAHSNEDADSSSDSDSSSDEDFNYADNADENEDENDGSNGRSRNQPKPVGYTKLSLRATASILQMPGSRMGEKTRSLMAHRAVQLHSTASKGGMSLMS